jgi:hypothetical protein
MKIIDPNNTTHDIRLIPRYYTDELIVLELTNEATNFKTIVSNMYLITDGYLNIQFDFEFSNKDRYSFKLTDTNGVLYRGKIYATSEETQDYKQSTDRYEY